MSDIEQDTPSGVKEEPPTRSDQDRELAEQLVAEANENGLDLVGPDVVLTELTKPMLEAGLEAR